jgi:hypothetical protein
MCNIIEHKLKIDYENNVLLRKIIDIEQKPSAYHPTKLNPKRCPAFDDINKHHRSNYQRSILDNQNMKLYKRLVSAKSEYRADAHLKDYYQNQYFEHMISKTKSKKYYNK